MARATWVQSNFNGGEWSPLAHGRFDLAKYRNGLELCSRFLPTQQGGLTRCPGTIYTAGVKDSTYAPRLVPFVFSLTQAYILEFGANYIRFYTNDGQLSNAQPAWIAGGHSYVVGDQISFGTHNWTCNTNNTSGTSFLVDGPLYWTQGAAIGPLEVATYYTAAEVWELDFEQKFDTLYITHPSLLPAKLQRLGAVNWTWAYGTFLDGPYLPTNVSATTLTPSGTSGTVDVIASSVVGINGGLGFTSNDYLRMLRIKCGGVWLSGRIVTITADPKHIQWQIDPPNGQQLPTTAKATANVSGGSIFTVSVTDGGNGYGTTPPSVTFSPRTADPATISITVDGSGVITAATLTHGGSGYASDPTVTITSSGGSGAIIFAHVSGGTVVNVYLAAGGTGYAPTDTATVSGGGSGGGSGAVGYATVSNGVVTAVTMSVTGTGYSSGADVIFSAPVPLVPSTTTFWRLGEWNLADGYPAHVVLHQDRLCFSGNAANPGRIDGSNTGDYENFAPTELDGTVTDSNAFAFTTNSGPIQWLASDKQGLLCGAEAGEYVLAPSGTQQAITATNVNSKPVGNYGSVNVKPIRIGNVTLFIQRTGRKLRELIYQFAYDTFTNVDISLVAEHLTKGGLKQMAVQFAPYQIVWIARTDGTLVGMTYDRDQEVNGWHRHPLGGYSDAAQTLPPLVESVACIPAPSTRRDEVWLVVNRYINGATVRTIERMAKVWEDGDALADAIFLDSSATYSGAPTTTISGLTWLKGQTVGVLTDGSVHPDCVVSSTGTITLNWAATKVQVGLKYASQAKTLRVEAGGADGPSQGKLKRIMWTIFRFFQTSKFDLWSETPGIGFESKAFRDSNDPMTTAVPLFDGDKRWTYDGTWASDGQIYFQASGPLPCNVNLLMAQVDTKEMQ